MITPDDVPYVLVGFDGSQASRCAVAFAVDEARMRGRSLAVCHAWQWPYPVRPTSPLALEPVQRRAAAVLAAGVTEAERYGPDLRVLSLLRTGAPAAALLVAADDAEVVVLGSRGYAGFADLRLGSAAYQVPAHAPCPVIVVRGEAPLDRAERIVVGYDGSPASEAALAFALEEARMRGAEVVAVNGWDDQGLIADGAFVSADLAAEITAEDLRAAAAQHLESALPAWREKYPDVPLRMEVIIKPPRAALLDLARGAGLLVVGSRGAGGFAGLRLGSVPHAILHHAPCPVAIVPTP